MKNLWLIAAGAGLAGAATYFITNNLRNSNHESVLPKGRRRHLTSAFKKTTDMHTEE